ncbi:hypothetical protein AKJ51_00570 [candidate division MSBL1 archaeon SCGC-AAA382A20]|uniref:Response regulatory domain-containing protein n=1 Tax=candidate division MSBL1 archaeon SCGC-AAA382A20 TaxID=1698280 RepID=A0A133VMJ9_9EURY|nr:hypothetical protein AKJ51_00570 [candidate division MSBL1 archaeon SCGC-AAA382A20]
MVVENPPFEEDILKVLIVDDEPDFLEQAKLFLEKENEDLEVETVSSGEEGLKLAEEEEFDCI